MKDGTPKGRASGVATFSPELLDRVRAFGLTDDDLRGWIGEDFEPVFAAAEHNDLDVDYLRMLMAANAYDAQAVWQAWTDDDDGWH